LRRNAGATHRNRAIGTGLGGAHLTRCAGDADGRATAAHGGTIPRLADLAHATPGATARGTAALAIGITGLANETIGTRATLAREDARFTAFSFRAFAFLLVLLPGG